MIYTYVYIYIHTRICVYIYIYTLYVIIWIVSIISFSISASTCCFMCPCSAPLFCDCTWTWLFSSVVHGCFICFLYPRNANYKTWILISFFQLDHTSHPTELPGPRSLPEHVHRDSDPGEKQQNQQLKHVQARTVTICGCKNMRNHWTCWGNPVLGKPKWLRILLTPLPWMVFTVSYQSVGSSKNPWLKQTI